MAIKLKQSTASQEVPLGYFVDNADGNTEETGLTIANTDIKIWKNGATTLANKNSGGATHISNGIYYAVLDATDTDTLGPLVIFIHVSGALPIRLECEVLVANVYDSLVAASDNLQVDTVQIEGTDATDQLDAHDGSPLDAAGIRSAVGLASANLDTQLDALPTAAENADAVWDEDATGHQTQGTFGQAIGDPVSDSDTIWALVNSNLDTTVSSRASQTSVDTIDDFLDTEVAAILADTNELQTDLADGGRLDLLVDAIKAKTDNLPADPADDSDIDTQLAAIAGYIDTEVATILAAVDTEVAAIKAKTDSLTFTVAGQIDANIQYINDAQITGDGSATPWGPV